MARKARKEVSRSEIIRLLAALFLLPLGAAFFFSIAFALAAPGSLFPDLWLFLVMVTLLAFLSCVLFAAYRSIIFGFSREVALRIQYTIDPDGSGNEPAPFLLFHAGQEFEIIAESIETWRGDLKGVLDRSSSSGEIWALDAHIRFPFAGAATAYRTKSLELKKNKLRQNLRSAAVLAFFIDFQDPEPVAAKKHLERTSALFADLIAGGERYGGVAAEISWNAFWLIFSSGSDDQTCAMGAIRAAKEIYDRAERLHPEARLRVLADYFPVCESMLLAGKAWRYHAESPGIAALRAAVVMPIGEENAGLRFSSRIVQLVRARGGTS
ncbi:MAG: hypothetical protein LBC99_08450 [Spirochaetota bacterium]|jgi:hypothetical protein|nr:hypothetical protein [Spirochaetota bacterium]